VQGAASHGPPRELQPLIITHLLLLYLIGQRATDEITGCAARANLSSG
jgi:hypothetical protein